MGTCPSCPRRSMWGYTSARSHRFYGCREYGSYIQFVSYKPKPDHRVAPTGKHKAPFIVTTLIGGWVRRASTRPPPTPHHPPVAPTIYASSRTACAGRAGSFCVNRDDWGYRTSVEDFPGCSAVSGAIRCRRESHVHGSCAARANQTKNVVHFLVAKPEDRRR